MAHMRLSRAGRKEKILLAMHRDDHAWQTVNSIAKLIGLKPSTYVRGLLWELIASNEVVYEEVNTCANSAYVEKRVYALTERVMTQQELKGFLNDE